MKKIIYGNWKLNQGLAEVKLFSETLCSSIPSDIQVGVAPQLIHLKTMKDLSPIQLKIGAQNIAGELNGAFTGETSIKSLKEINADFVLVGHSERRSLFGETNAECAKKVKLAQEENIEVVYCIGETLDQRESNQTFEIIKEQVLEGLSNINSLEGIILAYEPVWAIGTGKSATSDQAQEVHSYIKNILKEKFNSICPILYGGSVKAANAAELMQKPDIDGALVGGASLKLESFVELCKAASNS